MKKSSHDLYVIFERRQRKPWNWSSTRFVRARRRKPKLKPGQIAFKLQIEVPDAAFDILAVPIIADTSHAIRPGPTATVQPE